MINLLSQHYQWIFSGIGVLFFTIIYNILKKKPQSILKKTFEDNSVTIKGNKNTSMHIGDNVVNNYNIEQEKEREKGNSNISDFEALVISKVIKESPPFQKNQIAANYKGIRIKWEVSLQSMHEPEGNKVRIMSLYKKTYPWVNFYIDIEKHPIFKVANTRKEIYCYW